MHQEGRAFGSGIDFLDELLGAAGVARGFGLNGATVTSLGRFESLFREHQQSGGATLWDVHIDDLIPSRQYRRVHYGEA